MAYEVLLFLIYISAAFGTRNAFDKKIKMEDLSILKSPYVHMKNESSVFEKLNTIVSQGANKLQFVTDFDETVTKQHENGIPILSSVAILFQSKMVPESKSNAYKIARSKYRTIILNPTIPIEQKIKTMKEVQEIWHKCLQGFEFDRSEIENLVGKYGPPFRNGTIKLFSKLKNLDIPVVLFSGGLSDVIEERLRRDSIKFDNINIIANHLKFNGTQLDGLQNYEDLIHAFNKHEHISGYINTKIFENRTNIILMGDNTGDATMVREYENDGTVLKIGFYYGQADEGLDIFKNTFDIVLNDDQTMNVIIDIIKLLE